MSAMGEQWQSCAGHHCRGISKDDGRQRHLNDEFAARTRCPLYGQGPQAIRVFIRQRVFLQQRPLDSFPARAQDRSYTNKSLTGRKWGYDGVRAQACS